MEIRSTGAIIAEGIGRYGSGRESVLRILCDINREHGWVSEDAIRQLSRATGASSAEIAGIASFYSFISLEPRGRHIVRLCNTITCEMKGSREILEALECELHISAGETTPDGRITLETTSCLGLCDQSPAMLVDETPHSGLTPEKACEIVRGLR